MQDADDIITGLSARSGRWHLHQGLPHRRLPRRQRLSRPRPVSERGTTPGQGPQEGVGQGPKEGARGQHQPRGRQKDGRRPFSRSALARWCRAAIAACRRSSMAVRVEWKLVELIEPAIVVAVYCASGI